MRGVVVIVRVEDRELVEHFRAGEFDCNVREAIEGVVKHCVDHLHAKEAEGTRLESEDLRLSKETRQLSVVSKAA